MCEQSRIFDFTLCKTKYACNNVGNKNREQKSAFSCVLSSRNRRQGFGDGSHLVAARRSRPPTVAMSANAADLVPAVEAYLEANGLKETLSAMKAEAKAKKMTPSKTVRARRTSRRAPTETKEETSEESRGFCADCDDAPPPRPAVRDRDKRRIPDRRFPGLAQSAGEESDRRPDRDG